jgi:hypothetical protein
LRILDPISHWENRYVQVYGQQIPNAVRVIATVFIVPAAVDDLFCRLLRCKMTVVAVVISKE